MGKKKIDLRKKREAKKQKRKKGLFESGQKIYYQFVETGPGVEQMLNNPMMMLFLQHGKVKELIEEFANKLPHPCSNNHRTNIEMLRMTLFMIMGGYSSPEDFNAKVSESERNHYNIKIGVTTYYDWLERIKECEQVYAEKYSFKYREGFSFENQKWPQRIFDTKSPSMEFDKKFMEEAITYAEKKIKELL